MKYSSGFRNFYPKMIQRDWMFDVQGLQFAADASIAEWVKDEILSRRAAGRNERFPLFLLSNNKLSMLIYQFNKFYHD